jgi:hypothetical protein
MNDAQFVPAYSRVRGAGDDSIDKNMAKTIPANIPLTIHINHPISHHRELMLNTFYL